MAIPAAALAIGVPAVGKFLGGLFGGKKTISPEQQQAMFLRSFQAILKQLPKLNTEGLLADSSRTIDRSGRIAQGQQRQRFSDLFGPNVVTAGQASAGTRIRQRGLETKLSEGRRIGQLGAEFGLSRAQTALGGAGALFGSQLSSAQQPSRFGSALGSGLQSAGQAGGDIALFKLMKDMGLFKT